MLPQTFQFSPLIRRAVEGQFSGGHITSNAGLLLLREVDQQIQLSATLYRFEAKSDRRAIIEAHRVLWEQFIASHTKTPKRIVLDFDATDIPLHGDQPEKFFHGYYDHYCYLPLYVFCDRFPLVAYLRQSKIDGAKHAGAILKLLVTFIRQHWPKVQIIFRGDSGFCRQLILNWCERHGVDYLVGIARNSRMEALVAPTWEHVEKHHQQRKRAGETGSTRWFWRWELA